MRPTRIERLAGDRLGIEWDEGGVREYTVRELRDACPCATCREQRSQEDPTPELLPVLSVAETQPLTILAMEPMGNYAYTIQFSDGHDTGIYEFELLNQLGSVANPEGG